MGETRPVNATQTIRSTYKFTAIFDPIHVWQHKESFCLGNVYRFNRVLKRGEKKTDCFCVLRKKKGRERRNMALFGVLIRATH